MNRNVAFWRKIIYISAIAVLLVPLYIIGSPSRRADGDLRGGGGLAAMRDKYRLSQVGLGEIDPAGEAMRLACLGMRGVAAAVLWNKANYYKKTEQFDNMAATVNQITKLQPNFIEVWEFHAHNLSFNTSVEYDDFRFRYHWVKRGIEFLMRGMRFNQDDTQLLWHLGWFTEQKLGRSDEYLQFRELFREDYDFHNVLQEYIHLNEALGPDRLPDCWLVGRQWYLTAEDLVDNKGVPIRGRSPVLFHAHPSMSLMYYAMAVEEDGYLGEVGRLAWVDAGDSWRKYGSREVMTSYGFRIRLNDQEEFEEEIEELAAELDQLVPGAREKLRAEKYEELEENERAALEVPADQRTMDQAGLANYAESKLAVDHESVAEEATPANRKEAWTLARRIANREWMVNVISRYRDIVNFQYWRTRCDAEQTTTAITARKLVYQADQAFDDIDFVKAKALYEEAWKNWGAIFQEHPSLLEDVSAEDVIAAVLRYSKCLDQLGEPFPDPFILQSLLDLHRELQPTEYGEKLAPFAKKSESEPEKSGDSKEPEESGATDSTDESEPLDKAQSEDESGSRDEVNEPAETKAGGDVDPDAGAEKPAEDGAADDS